MHFATLSHKSSNFAISKKSYAMTTIYIIIVVFLLLLAVFDLFVGVSNDAVNFLNSSVGARVAKWRTLLILAAVGVLVGALMSSGMMDVARHGIMQPQNFSFADVMTVFLAVMVTDVIVLDRFNSMGLPTSTTVSLVFELFGAATLLSFFRMAEEPTLAYADLINTDKCLSVIVAIFVSVAIAFICGLVLQWLSRLIFTFQHSKVRGLAVSIFGGLSFTVLAYFIFIKGLGGSPFISADARAWVAEHTLSLMSVIFLVSVVISYVLTLARVGVFKVVVLMGTFALAMAFAGNDLVNFIGVPYAGYEAFQNWYASGCPDADSFMMTSLQGSAKSPWLFLFLAGIIMILALAFSRKAMNVIKTSVDLSRQDEGDEMFGSSRAARSVVRMVESWAEGSNRFVPRRMRVWVARRFDNRVVDMPEGAAFDVVRAAVNLVVASVLIVIGTSYKLPLSTTYVTFMVAMGTSLADKAWGRETAVFRVTGVMSVIGGWFLTAAVAFIASAIVCAIMHFCGFVAMFLLMALAIFVIIKSNFSKSEEEEKVAQNVRSAHNVDLVDRKDFCLNMANEDTRSMQTALTIFDDIVDGFFDRRIRPLRRMETSILSARCDLDSKRRRELQEYSKLVNQGNESDTSVWLHLDVDCRGQYFHSLRRMLEPIKNHVDNGFNPAPRSVVEEFAPLRRQVAELFAETDQMIQSGNYADYESLRVLANELRKRLKAVRHAHMVQMQNGFDRSSFKVMMVYINLLRETQNLVNTLRHHMEAAKCFNNPVNISPEEMEIINNSEY